MLVEPRYPNSIKRYFRALYLWYTTQPGSLPIILLNEQGQVLLQDTFDMVELTPTHLTIRDSSGVVHPNCGPGTCYSVHRSYYPR